MFGPRKTWSSWPWHLVRNRIVHNRHFQIASKAESNGIKTSSKAGKISYSHRAADNAGLQHLNASKKFLTDLPTEDKITLKFHCYCAYNKFLAITAGNCFDQETTAIDSNIKFAVMNIVCSGRVNNSFYSWCREECCLPSRLNLTLWHVLYLEHSFYSSWKNLISVGRWELMTLTVLLVEVHVKQYF